MIIAVLVPIFVYLYVRYAYLLKKGPFIIVDSYLIQNFFRERNRVIYLFDDLYQAIFDDVFGSAITGCVIDGKATLRISLNYY